jgi:hypothetical protein
MANRMRKWCDHLFRAGHFLRDEHMIDSAAVDAFLSYRRFLVTA